MPEETTTPEPTLDHTDARRKAQLVKAQAAFAHDLVEAFHALITKAARTEVSPLATLTLAQLDELLLCLHETVTQPPPDSTDALDTLDKEHD